MTRKPEKTLRAIQEGILSVVFLSGSRFFFTEHDLGFLLKLAPEIFLDLITGTGVLLGFPGYGHAHQTSINRGCFGHNRLTSTFRTVSTEDNSKTIAATSLEIYLKEDFLLEVFL